MSNLPDSATINKNGQLVIGGLAATKLAQKFGTPLYVVDEQTVRNRCRQYLEAFHQYYPNTEIIFASKALCTVGLSRVIASEGLGFDVSSGGELFTVLKAKADPAKIYFHGNNKSSAEIVQGLKSKVGRFVVDNQFELANLAAVAKKLKKTANILIRINPGIEAHTHEFIQTGKIDSKFGVPLDQLEDLVNKAKTYKNVRLCGFQAHIGSQILDLAPFVAVTKLLLELTKKYGTAEINIGGGLGIPYLADQSAPSIAELAKQVTAVLKGKTQAKLVVEPGRSIVGQAGITLYTIGVSREIPGIRRYLIVDGGMNDNPRYILYQAKYEALLADKANAPKTETVTIGGRFCESGDIIIKDGQLPPAKVGDLVAVLGTGAYNYSMASNYNRVPRPAMVLVNKGQAKLIVRRERNQDLIRNDV